MGLLTSLIIGGAAIAGGVIASQGAQKAAKTQAQAQEQQIQAQQQAAEQARADQQTAIAKEEASRQEAITKKEAAVRDIKFPTFLESPEAQKLKGTLEERIAGRGLIDVGALSAPAAAQRRAGLKETEAAISATASARGLGRSTVPVAQIGEASQAAERDIAERVSQLELVKQNQIQDAIGRYETLVGRESTSREQKAIFDRGGEFAVAETISGAAEKLGADEVALAESFKSDQFAIANAIAQKGVDQAAFELKQAEIWASAITGATTGATTATQLDDIISAIENKQKGGPVVLRSGNLPGTTSTSPFGGLSF